MGQDCPSSSLQECGRNLTQAYVHTNMSSMRQYGHTTACTGAVSIEHCSSERIQSVEIGLDRFRLSADEVGNMLRRMQMVEGSPLLASHILASHIRASCWNMDP